MASNKVKPLIVIVGPTASGKTSVAIEIAKKFDGEVICADSRTVYKGMDIGTAKPSISEQEGIRHHLLDIVRPDQQFTVAEFKTLADKAISDIRMRGKLPILVGGSGLYINSVIYDYDFAGSDGPRDSQNPRHLSADTPKQTPELVPDTVLFGIEVDKDALKTRIKQRVESMVANGLVEETKLLGSTYGWDIAPMQASAYTSFREYIDGSVELVEAIEHCARLDGRLAKKQRTWFKRNKSIQWVDNPSKIVDLTTTLLNN
ncbi:MAG: tRNA (adenosine(37)-N6)-dimethylallyltransferase MiaA [Candidatus Saccharibacteria bacterium]|nr:tRNA (adenosine(37)-N6)-dimethylallyltransferase MiaA [Candidatus Saccharibacteria bacterium]